MAVRRRTTLKDVAEAVGVHVSTVSRALNPDTRHFIRPEVAKRILDVSSALNYRPNAAALSLRTNRTRIIGVLIPDISNPVFPPIIRGIEDALSEVGYVAILVNAAAHGLRQTQLLAALSARGVDGLIVASLQRDDAAVRRTADEGVPIVTVNRRSDDTTIASVTNDDSGGMGLILDHLYSLGHRRVACIAGPQDLSTGHDRYAAFEQHRRRAGFDTEERLVIFAEAFSEHDGERAAEVLLDRRVAFTALVACNDLLAVGALGALKARGITCPAELSVTGFNDMPMVDRLEPALTTVRVQQYEAGKCAAQMVLAKIGGCTDQCAPHIVLPVELVVRGSTGRPGR
ncbi:MAG: LacI family DNA-binding transcriptional regulator [Hyphomicrobiaceae bacterium]